MKLRVLMFAWEYPPRIVGGLARVVHGLSHEVTRLGHEVHVVTMDHPGTGPYTLDGDVHVHRVKADEWCPDFATAMNKFNFAMLRLAMKLHMQQPFHVIHSHDWMVSDAANVMKSVFRLPIVTTIHATEFGRMNGIKNDQQRYVDESERLLIERSDMVIVNSAGMAEELVQRWQTPRNKLAVVANGITPSAVQCVQDASALRRKHHLGEGPIILFVGRLVWEKGVHVLLQAGPAILEAVPNATIVIAGTGNYMGELQAMASSLMLHDRVRFFGQANDRALAELYKMAACFVAPSLYEPFGIVALEAMAAEVPLVTSDRGGLAEINLHEKSGLTTFAEDPGSVAYQVIRLLRNPGYAEVLKAAALERVLTEYSWPLIAGQTVRVYETAMNLSLHESLN